MDESQQRWILVSLVAGLIVAGDQGWTSPNEAVEAASTIVQLSAEKALKGGENYGKTLEKKGVKMASKRAQNRG